MGDKPEFSIKDGMVNATTWRNEGEKGDYFTTSIIRVYHDRSTGNLRHSTSFSGADLLKVSALAQESYQRSRDILQEERLAKRRDEQRNTDRITALLSENRKRSVDDRER